mgnify:FL=1
MNTDLDHDFLYCFLTKIFPLPPGRLCAHFMVSRWDNDINKLSTHSSHFFQGCIGCKNEKSQNKKNKGQVKKALMFLVVYLFFV